MALAYTSPTWTDGSGTGISASQLQALCNCVEGLVQGSDKALHNIAINGSTMTLTFADGSQETASTDVKGISSIDKTGTSGLVDTYTITYTDGSTSTFTITNGSPGVDATAYHPDDAYESTLADNDRFPFYDTSASAKRRTTWENIKNKMYDFLNLDFYSKTDSTATTFNDTDYIPRYNAKNGTKWKVTWSNVKSLLKTYFDQYYNNYTLPTASTSTLGGVKVDGTTVTIDNNGVISSSGGGGANKADITAIGTNEAGTTASRAYAVGEHFYKNGKFCTAKTAIASGATFTLGTNYVEGTVADALALPDYSRTGITLGNNVEWYVDPTYSSIKFGGVAKFGNIVVINARLKLTGNIARLDEIMSGLPNIKGYSEIDSTHDVAYCQLNGSHKDIYIPLYLEQKSANNVKIVAGKAMNMSDNVNLYINGMYITY